MCLTPWERKHDGAIYPVNCGRCQQCTVNRISGWSYRLMVEEQNCSSAFFVTLTYSTDTVPITKNGFMNLRKSDLQKFFKRLRKHELNKNNKIKYYAVGEYGGRYLRPHYHIILFNASLDSLFDAWKLKQNEIGHIHIGTVSTASVGYTLKYINKAGKIPLHNRDDRQKEFSLMSKGLGKQYLTNAVIQWHHADMVNRAYIPLSGQSKIALPRYYSTRLYDKNQKQLIANQSDARQKERIQRLLSLPDYDAFHEKLSAALLASTARMDKKAKTDTKF